MANSIETNQLRIDDLGFIKARDKVADELVETLTDPEWASLFPNPQEIVNAIKAGTLDRYWDKGGLISGVIVRVGQDLRLTPDDIDILKIRIFKN